MWKKIFTIKYRIYGVKIWCYRVAEEQCEERKKASLIIFTLTGEQEVHFHKNWEVVSAVGFAKTSLPEQQEQREKKRVQADLMRQRDHSLPSDHCRHIFPPFLLIRAALFLTMAACSHVSKATTPRQTRVGRGSDFVDNLRTPGHLLREKSSRSRATWMYSMLYMHQMILLVSQNFLRSFY